jgi:hypothetical protein
MSRRTRRNVSRTAGLALVAVALLLVGTSGSAGADGPGATLAAKGWWWQAQDSRLPKPLPAPPNVKAGQLNVQGSPNGKAAYAAVRYTIDSNHTVGSFTLKVADDAAGSGAVLLACRTGSAWTPAEAGAWSSAPTIDDKSCINGQKATDGKSWSFAVGTLQLEKTLDIAIVPGVDPSTKQSPTFSIVFDAPANDSLATTAGPPPTVSTSPSNSAKNTAGAGAGTGSSAGTGAGSTFHPPAAVTPVATGLPASKVGETATSPAKQAASQPGLDTALTPAAADKERNKTPGYIVLAFAAAIGLYAWRQDNLIARNGGSRPGATAEQGGLGRFSRPREGQPPALT